MDISKDFKQINPHSRSVVPNVKGNHPYFCSLCGIKVLVSDTLFDSLTKRKTDDAIICLNKLTNLMKKDKLVVIKRGVNKYEKQYTWVCQNCGALIAYQPYDFEDEGGMSEIKQRSKKIFSQNRQKVLYIHNDAVVTDPRQSLL